MACGWGIAVCSVEGCTWAGEASCKAGTMKIIIWFIAWSWRGWGHLGSASLLVLRQQWLHMETGDVWVSTNKSTADDETSPRPERVTRGLCRSSGRKDPTVPSDSPISMTVERKGKPKLLDHRNLCSISSFSTALELYHLWGKLFKLCLVVQVCYMKRVISTSQRFY